MAQRQHRPGQGGGVGTSGGLDSQDDRTARIKEVLARLKAVDALTELENLPEVASSARLVPIRELTRWARLHAAVALEHGEAA